MLSLDARHLVSVALYRAKRRHLLWPTWWALLAAALAALGAGLLTGRAQSRELGALQVELNEVTSQAVAASAAARPSAQPLDFTVTLPEAAPTSKLLRETFMTAARTGVAVVSAQPQEALGDGPSGLGHATLSLRLAGQYPGIKTLVNELLARFPGLTVEQLRIQRASGNGTGVQDATLVFQQWLRPRTAQQASSGTGG